jgi:hypothetical protein
VERIVVTGDRGWADGQRVIDTLDSQLSYGEFLLGVGDCETGVDLAAWHWGLSNLSWPVTRFHAPWQKKNRAAGPIRNHFMIDEFRPTAVFAFLTPQSRGTVDCANYAESRGITVFRFHGIRGPGY